MCLIARVAAAIADAPQKRGQLLLEHRLDGRAYRLAQPILDRIAAGLEQ